MPLYPLVLVFFFQMPIGEVLKNRDLIPYATAIPAEDAYLKTNENLYYCRNGQCQKIEPAFSKGMVGFQTERYFASYRYMDAEGGFLETPDCITVWEEGEKKQVVKADFPARMASVVCLEDGLVVFELEDHHLLVKKFNFAGVQIATASLETPIVDDRYTRSRVCSLVHSLRLKVWVPRSNFFIELGLDLNVLNLENLQFSETLNKVPKHLFGQFIDAVDGGDIKKRDHFMEAHGGQIFRHEPYGLMLDEKDRPVTFYQVLMVEPDRPNLKFMSINTLLITHGRGEILREKLLRHYTVYGFTGEKWQSKKKTEFSNLGKGCHDDDFDFGVVGLYGTFDNAIA